MVENSQVQIDQKFNKQTLKNQKEFLLHIFENCERKCFKKGVQKFLNTRKRLKEILVKQLKKG